VASSWSFILRISEYLAGHLFVADTNVLIGMLYNEQRSLQYKKEIKIY